MDRHSKDQVRLTEMKLLSFKYPFIGYILNYFEPVQIGPRKRAELGDQERFKIHEVLDHLDKLEL